MAGAGTPRVGPLSDPEWEGGRCRRRREIVEVFKGEYYYLEH